MRDLIEVTTTFQVDTQPTPSWSERAKRIMNTAGEEVAKLVDHHRIRIPAEVSMEMMGPGGTMWQITVKGWPEPYDRSST